METRTNTMHGQPPQKLCTGDIYALSNTEEPQQIQKTLLTSHHNITCHVMY
jgi:hypothetical protein